MQNLLIILDGKVAAEFVRILVSKHLDKNYYCFISRDSSLLPKSLPSGSEAHNFDPNNAHKLREVLNPNFGDAFVIMDEKDERRGVYELLRSYSESLQITILGDLGFMPNDKHLNLINTDSVLAFKMYERFPNVPRFARYIGQGQGEIMQVSVPFGSSYCYRAVGSIKQKKWQIAAIYRENELILPKANTTILPNDSMIIVGEPAVLWDIYHRIKDEIGQFPTPFGRDVCAYFDMSKPYECELEQVLWLFSHFKHKRLWLCFYNPQSVQDLQSLRVRLDSHELSWRVDFNERNLKKMIELDRASKNVGLLVLNSTQFGANLRFLGHLGVPILKLGSILLKDLKECVMIAPKSPEDGEKISSVVFDISAQLHLPFVLYEFIENTQGDSGANESCVDYYKHLSKIFSRKMKVERSSTINPIFWLKEQKQVLQILPLRRDAFSLPLIFCLTNTERLSTKLTHQAQLFVPIFV